MDLTQFGIGGYYMIIRSEHSFGPGKSDTTITAKWVAEIDAALTQDPNTDPEEDACKTQAANRTESALGGFVGKVVDAVMGDLDVSTAE